MEDVIKITVISVICAVCVLLIKQYRPELSLFAQVAGLVAILVVGMAIISKVISYCESVFSESLIDSGYLTLLLKALGIAVVSKIGGDLCRDSGNSALAFGVELAAKAAILLLTLPMLKNLADVTSGLLKG